MRTLIVSDIHGNAAALEAVAGEPHDAVVCLGDIVGYGPEAGACLRWVRRHSMLVLQGNHDRALAEGVAPRCRPAFEALAAAMAPVGRAQLEAAELRWLAELPREAARDLDGVPALLLHATPSDPLYRYLGPDQDEWNREVAGLDARLLLVGHTHLPFDLSCGTTRVVNPGSVGQPKDGDPRAAYAVLENGVLRLKRTEYDVARTVTGLARSGAPPEVVADLGYLLRTGHLPSTRAGP
jgi:predicted phosphodiesterase